MSSISRAEHRTFFVLALLVQAFVLLRAVVVPFVHDEAVSFIAYAQPGTFLPFASMWDAGNHVLNSLCGHIGYRLFGLHPLSIRWASVLSYALYAWCAWRLGARIDRALIRWMLWSALLACPFLLDFFSLFRGYAPAIAFMMLTLEQALRFLHDRTKRSLSMALAALTVACLFMLALLPFALMMLILLLYAVRRSPAQIAVWMVLGVIPFTCLALLARHMAGLGLLYYGNADGYGITTVGSLLRYVLHVEGAGWRWLVIALVTIVSAWLLMAGRLKRLKEPVALIAALLWGECLLRVMLAAMAGLNFAEDRTALYVLVLAILLVAFGADALSHRWARAQGVAVLLLAFPMRALVAINAERTELWPEQSIPPRFIARIEAMERELGRPAIVGMHRFGGLPYGLHRRMRGGEGDGTAASWPNTPADARLQVVGVPFAPDQRYTLVDSTAGKLRLYVRKRSWPSRIVADSLFNVESRGELRSSGFTIDPVRVRESDVVVEAEGATSATDALDLRVCVAAWDSSGNALHADHNMLAMRRAYWNGERWRTALLIPRQPGAQKAQLFFWEVGARPYVIKSGRIRVHAME